MKHCTQCGHVLGLGRFCTNCGHPVASRHADPLSDPLPDPATEPAPAPGPDPLDRGEEPAQDWRANTAERVQQATPAESPLPARPVVPPPVAPRLPPAVVEPPPPPRFPLFADEVVTTQPAGVEPGATAAWYAAEPDDASDGELDGDWDEDEDWEEWDDGRRPRALRLVGAVLLLTAIFLGAWFVGQTLGGEDDPGEGATDEPSASRPAAGGQDAVDHTADAAAEAPRTAPSTQDVDGNPTSYDASNMLDGVPETAWRAAGDGSGLKLVFTFPERTRISEVGLVNGYAKTDTDDAGATFDWYAGHRRITQVTWNFGVGDVVRQDLDDDPALQTVEVEAVEVRKVVLKIVATTAPGQGPTRRNYTAISDVFLAG